MSDHLAKTMKFGVREKTLTSYLMGFFLSLLFTFSAFALIGWHVLRAETAYIVITVLAIAQLFAQIIFFLPRLQDHPHKNTGHGSHERYFFPFNRTKKTIGGKMIH